MELSDIVYLTMYLQRKATYIKRTCEILQRNYDCDIPATVPDLCKLPGVGPKMAYLCMNSAWKINVGIGTHFIGQPHNCLKFWANVFSLLSLFFTIR